MNFFDALDLILNFGDLWWRGLSATFFLSAGSIGMGTLLALIFVIGVKSRYFLVKHSANFLLDLLRAIPALVLIGTMFFLLPAATGWRISPLTIALIALSLNLSPFAAECIRSGIESVPTIQYESGLLAGFTGWKLNYYIIGPQAIRRIIPPLSGQWVTTIKLSSLAATIGVPEIWHVTGQVVTNTSLPIESRLFGALLYIALILPLLWLLRYFEHRFHVLGVGEGSER